eukprot:TRINITY_DN3215_c0_g1_i1.p1 TRINITY_DN3215_c0_g1~~TRINITY_DN3215_c0_g1_i1.p1  ORF type:complete len:430 (+),score=49.25 TRINITY_DN3215_c0_g1_i1:1488-2777(+)
MEPFKLERWFAEFEFRVPNLLCCSDCETHTIGQILELDTSGAWPGQALASFLSLPLSYTEAPGGASLRQEIATLYTNVDPQHVLVTAGAEEAIYLFFHALLQKGDSVLVHYPCYQSLFQVARSIGCDVVKWETTIETKWALDLKKLRQILEYRKSISKPIKCIVINCPHNPTGYSLPPKKLAKLIRIAARYDIYILADEVYRMLEWNDESRLSPVSDLYPKGVSVGVMSKSLGLAGVRIGWLASQDSDILRRAATLKDYTTICSSAPSEFLSEIALKNREKILKRNLEIVQRNLALLDQFFARYSHIVEWVPPVSGPVAFPRIKFESIAPEHRAQFEPDPTQTAQPHRMEQFCRGLVKSKGLLLLPGTCFDLPADDKTNKETDNGSGTMTPTTAPSYGDHFRLGFGRADLPALLPLLGAYLDEITTSHQ